jgi:CP family cyanate transporter-like MFS transporter
LPTPLRDRVGVAPGLLLGALFLAGLDLRAPIASVPPLVPRISSDLTLSGAAAGLLTTVPVLCMGVFAPSAQRVAARVGRELTVVAALTALTAGLLLRLSGSVVVLLYLGTFLAGVGIATAQTVLPGIVKDHFPRHAGAVTGLYLVAMSGGAALAAGTAVPLADAVGSWAPALAVWTAPAAVALAAWGVVTRRQRAVAQAPVGGALPWHSPTARLLTAYLAVQSTLFYSQLAWISPAYVDRGWSGARAGLLLSVFNAVQLVAALVVPAWSDRMVDRRPLLFLAVGCSLVGMVALVAAPELAPWPAMAVLGFGQGAGFGLGLVMLATYAASPADAARLSAMAFLVAYLLAAAGPVLVGAAHDAAGSFTPAFGALLAIDVAQLWVVSRFVPGRRV